MSAAGKEGCGRFIKIILAMSALQKVDFHKELLLIPKILTLDTIIRKTVI
jgi:hypothetical protein